MPSSCARPRTSISRARKKDLPLPHGRGSLNGRSSLSVCKHAGTLRSRTRLRALGAWLLALALAAPAPAWNATGHRVIAAIAYDRIKPSTRAKIDALLARHPDYATLLAAGAPSDPAGRAREAFLDAAVWPDVIKGDNRFYDNTRANARPTALLPGFPSMARHTDWHYIDIPFSPDGTALEPPKTPNALEQLKRLIKIVGRADPDGAYDLPWLIHLVGDVHQPLHCASRFVQPQPHGDQGGNLVFVIPGRNLHAFWDDLAGTDSSDANVSQLAAQIAAEFAAGHGQHPRLSLDPKAWVQEGAKLAQTRVYTLGSDPGARDRPLTLTEGYHADAEKLARERMGFAAFRLSAVLDREFK